MYRSRLPSDRTHIKGSFDLLLEHVLQRSRQKLEDGVQDALLVLLVVVTAAPRDRLLGARQGALAGLLQGRFLLRLFLLLLLQPVLKEDSSCLK